MTGARALVALAAPLGAALLAFGCGDEPEPATVLDPLDLELSLDGEEASFDPDELVDDASFLDGTTFTEARVQELLRQPPYGRASFLETFQSNGVRAADAFARTGRGYGVNPLALLAFVQIRQGLVSASAYPVSSPSRVEYAFGCGCSREGACDPESAGLDRQLDCLARELRAAVDSVAASGATPRGFSPGKASRTLDGKTVTPANAATAAVYDQIPEVGEAGESRRGAWLFWNVFRAYAYHAVYEPEGTPGGAVVGDPCAEDATCTFEGGRCATTFPGGYCTAACSGACPASPNGALAVCSTFADEGYCFTACLDASSCRAGYACCELPSFGVDGPPEPVCVPDETAASSPGLACLRAP